MNPSVQPYEANCHCEIVSDYQPTFEVRLQHIEFLHQEIRSYRNLQRSMMTAKGALKDQLHAEILRRKRFLDQLL